MSINVFHPKVPLQAREEDSSLWTTEQWHHLKKKENCCPWASFWSLDKDCVNSFNNALIPCGSPYNVKSENLAVHKLSLWRVFQSLNSWKLYCQSIGHSGGDFIYAIPCWMSTMFEHAGHKITQHETDKLCAACTRSGTKKVKTSLITALESLHHK